MKFSIWLDIHGNPHLYPYGVVPKFSYIELVGVCSAQSWDQAVNELNRYIADRAKAKAKASA